MTNEYGQEQRSPQELAAHIDALFSQAQQILSEAENPTDVTPILDQLQQLNVEGDLTQKQVTRLNSLRQVVQQFERRSQPYLDIDELAVQGRLLRLQQLLTRQEATRGKLLPKESVSPEMIRNVIQRLDQAGLTGDDAVRYQQLRAQAERTFPGLTQLLETKPDLSSYKTQLESAQAALDAAAAEADLPSRIVNIVTAADAITALNGVDLSTDPGLESQYTKLVQRLSEISPVLGTAIVDRFEELLQAIALSTTQKELDGHTTEYSHLNQVIHDNDVVAALQLKIPTDLDERIQKATESGNAKVKEFLLAEQLKVFTQRVESLKAVALGKDFDPTAQLTFEGNTYPNLRAALDALYAQRPAPDTLDLDDIDYEIEKLCRYADEFVTAQAVQTMSDDELDTTHQDFVARIAALRGEANPDAGYIQAYENILSNLDRERNIRQIEEQAKAHIGVVNFILREAQNAHFTTAASLQVGEGGRHLTPLETVEESLKNQEIIEKAYETLPEVRNVDLNNRFRESGFVLLELQKYMVIHKDIFLLYREVDERLIGLDNFNQRKVDLTQQIAGITDSKLQENLRKNLEKITPPKEVENLNSRETFIKKIVELVQNLESDPNFDPRQMQWEYRDIFKQDPVKVDALTYIKKMRKILGSQIADIEENLDEMAKAINERIVKLENDKQSKWLNELRTRKESRWFVLYENLAKTNVNTVNTLTAFHNLRDDLNIALKDLDADQVALPPDLIPQTADQKTIFTNLRHNLENNLNALESKHRELWSREIVAESWYANAIAILNINIETFTTPALIQQAVANIDAALAAFDAGLAALPGTNLETLTEEEKAQLNSVRERMIQRKNELVRIQSDNSIFEGFQTNTIALRTIIDDISKLIENPGNWQNNSLQEKLDDVDEMAEDLRTEYSRLLKSGVLTEGNNTRLNGEITHLRTLYEHALENLQILREPKVSEMPLADIVDEIIHERMDPFFWNELKVPQGASARQRDLINEFMRKSGSPIDVNASGLSSQEKQERVDQELDRIVQKVRLQLWAADNKLQGQTDVASGNRKELFTELDRTIITRKELLIATTYHPKWGSQVREMLEYAYKSAAMRRGDFVIEMAINGSVKERVVNHVDYPKAEFLSANQAVVAPDAKNLNDATQFIRLDGVIYPVKYKYVSDLDYGSLTKEAAGRTLLAKALREKFGNYPEEAHTFANRIFTTFDLLTISLAELQKKTKTRGHNEGGDIDRIMAINPFAAAIHRALRNGGNKEDWSLWILFYLDDIPKNGFHYGKKPQHHDSHDHGHGFASDHEWLRELQSLLVDYQEVFYPTAPIRTNKIPLPEFCETLGIDLYNNFLTLNKKEWATFADTTDGEQLWVVDHMVDKDGNRVSTSANETQEKLAEKRWYLLGEENGIIKLLEVCYQKIPDKVSIDQITSKTKEGGKGGILGDVLGGIMSGEKMGPGPHLRNIMAPALTHLIYRLFQQFEHKYSNSEREHLYHEVMDALTTSRDGGGLEMFKKELTNVINALHEKPIEIYDETTGKVKKTKNKPVMSKALRPRENWRTAQLKRYLDHWWEFKYGNTRSKPFTIMNMRVKLPWEWLREKFRGSDLTKMEYMDFLNERHSLPMPVQRTGDMVQPKDAGSKH